MNIKIEKDIPIPKTKWEKIKEWFLNLFSNAKKNS